MEIARVRGQCTATIKEESLGGHRFALVQPVSVDGSDKGEMEVALDVTSAATGQLVLVARGSAARIPAETRQLATDLTVVAIVDDITVAPEPPRTRKTRARASSAHKR